MVCATPRNPPNNAYFLLDAHPLNNKGYTPNLIIIKNKIIENINMWNPVIKGVSAHNNKIKNTLIIGDKKKINWFLLKGDSNWFLKSLTASAIGCKTPIILTLLGPSRYWLYPKIFRSNKVIKATFNKIGTKINK